MGFDFGIIGGGPAGYTVAMRLAKQGKKVVLFEKDKLGGTCLNNGCIPTKSMLHSSEIYKQTCNLAEYGLDVTINSFDFSKIIEKREKTIEKIRKSLELAVKNSGVQVVYANAELKDLNTIVANDEEYIVNKAILATGAKPKEINNLKFDGKFILNSDDILKLETLPKSVLIVGSGAIGIEWARIFSNFGVEVSIVEMAEHLIPLADVEVSKRIERIFKQNKIKYYLNDVIENVEDTRVKLKSGEELLPEIVLVAVGRTPLETNKIPADVLGDASKQIQLAHYAISQGINYTLDKSINLNKNLIPSVIYGTPEIAWVGLREQDCTEDCVKITLPISALGKSWCDDSTEGFIKLITKDNLILGVHIISREASALIHQVLVAMQNNITVDKLKEICFAHPTYSEGVFEALCRL